MAMEAHVNVVIDTGGEEPVGVLGSNLVIDQKTEVLLKETFGFDLHKIDGRSCGICSAYLRRSVERHAASPGASFGLLVLVWLSRVANRHPRANFRVVWA
ncbi:MAG TPA: hypothetical protein VNA68_02815 [Candidatus Dormibacteraeota bacterium]|nr:hypothetical protein [Candidatus Dormibacteraeota bacterium]